MYEKLRIHHIFRDMPIICIIGTEKIISETDIGSIVFIRQFQVFLPLNVISSDTVHKKTRCGVWTALEKYQTVSLLRPCTSADTVNACLYRLVKGCDIPFGLNIEIAVGNIGIRPVKQF